MVMKPVLKLDIVKIETFQYICSNYHKHDVEEEEDAKTEADHDHD